MTPPPAGRTAPLAERAKTSEEKPAPAASSITDEGVGFLARIT